MIISLVREDAALLDQLQDPVSLHATRGLRVRDDEFAQVRDSVRQSFEFYASNGAVDPWRGYLSVDEDVVVGGGGFMGNPNAEGVVEIAYFTLPSAQARGYAKATAHALIACAQEHGARCAIAHTLTEENASCAVLRACGFGFEGAVNVEGDGEVWRWRRTLRSGTPPPLR